MTKDLYLRNGLKVVIWEVKDIYNHNPYNGDKIVVFYSYLLDSGKLGLIGSQEMFECDFYENFKAFNESVELSWSPKND
jgi:hypothetical protein